MAETIIFNPHQSAFLNSTQKNVGLFGGVGNGKTMVACKLIEELATSYPNNLCLIGRQTYVELRDSTKDMFMTELAKAYPPQAYTHNKSENSVDFWNKSKVIFRHMDNKESVLGPNLGAFYIDQAEEVDEDVFSTLQGRTRRENIPRYKNIVTGNPKPLTWPYYRFGVDKVSDEEISQSIKRDGYHSIVNGNYKMITAPTSANSRNLPPDYISDLIASWSPEWVERFVNGAWGVFEGAIFDVTQIRGYDQLPSIRLVISGVDPAISKEKAACNTAICTLGIGVDGYIYDLETIAGKWSFLETLEQIKGMVSRQNPRFIAVEGTAYQTALVEACQSELANHKEITVENAKADRDKFRRAKAVSHIISKGLFRTNNKELLSEISAFDADDKSGVRKDRVDALVHALHMMQKYAPMRMQPDMPKKKLNSFEYYWEKEVQQFQERNVSPLVTEVNPPSQWAKNVNDYY